MDDKWSIKGPMELDEEWGKKFSRAFDILYKLNSLNPCNINQKNVLLKELFGEIGEKSEVLIPFHCNIGTNIKLGKGVFINQNCVFLDTDTIEIGDYTMLAPGVNIICADHPVSTRERILPIDDDLEDEDYSYIDENGNFDETIDYTFINTKKPVKIGKRSWIGVNSIIIPGVTIGDNVVIGAGSVVTSDIPSNTVAVGSPARVIRKSI
ncbi:MAG: sugar O-acetyltransferase [Methanobrevibacter sp.]